MKKILITSLFALFFFMTGCVEEPIDCGEDKILVEGICLKETVIDDHEAYYSARDVILDSYYTTTDPASCTSRGIDETVCTDLTTRLRLLGEPREADDLNVFFTFNEDMSFQYIKFYPNNDKVLEFNGTLYVNESNVVQIKDFSYQIQDDINLTTVDLELLFEELLLNKSDSTICDLNQFQYSYQKIECEDFRDSVLLDNLNSIEDMIIETGEPTELTFGNSEVGNITADVSTMVFQFNERIYMYGIDIIDNTNMYYTVEQMEAFYEEMFDGGFTMENLNSFCQQPLRNYDDEGYTVNVEECNYYTYGLEDTDVLIEVTGFENAPEVFDIHVSEINGDRALLFINTHYLSEEYTRLSTIGMISTQAISLNGAETIISDFLDDYLVDPTQACTDFYEDAYDCTGFIIDPNLVHVDTLVVTRPFGGIYGKSFDVVVTDDVSNDTYSFSVVIEFLEDEIFLTDYYTGDYFD